MTARLVLATRNEHKVAELRRILADAGLGPDRVELVGAGEFPGLEDVPETGATFAENALIKARSVAGATGLPAIADDSGLAGDALTGMPGVLSARWAGGHGDDAANLQLVLAQIADVPAERRGGHFVCAAALVMPQGEEHVVEGRLDGTLVPAPRGSNGFGYDPIFLPEGESRTTAELAPEEKDAISHRGRAFRALVPVIAEMLGLPI
jgi:XTP/dITP diphosphohydrolase